jgi:hypothetical protein
MQAGFRIDQVKGMFFDSPAVTKAVEASEREPLSKAGAFIRRDAQQSIRSGKKSAQPFSPPKSHTGLFKRNIFFGWDASSRSVVVGAALFAKNAGNSVPALLEGGGPGLVRRRGKLLRANFQPHPYMGPAREKNEEKIGSVFADSVKG